MNLAELTDHVATADDKLTKGQAKSIVESVFKAIGEAAGRGEEVAVPGFGKFKVQDKPARQARNPRTGEMVDVAASKKMTFQPAKALKDSLTSKG